LRDPINVRLHLLFKSMNQMQGRKFDDALKTLEEVKRMDKDPGALDFDFGYAFGGKGMYKKSAEYFKNSVDRLGGEDEYSQSLVYLAAAYARIPGKRPEALKIAERLETSKAHVSPALIAIIYEGLGENEKAIEQLERAFRERDSLLRYIGVGYEYDGLRSDPRFKKLLKRTGLEESTS
ncbi:MAG: hypothetical protein OEM82_09950, partial [Acidobacteriota bacterium]|nr:hypothetical protein [Acidobacteriota bacterium]